MRATLKDIAQEVGVSLQLVSFYLNHPKTTRVAKETREKIDQAVDKLGYQPNPLARALSTGKTMTIGLVIGGLSRRNRGCFAHSLMNEANLHGYQFLISITNYDQYQERLALESLLNRHVDGILYTLYLDPDTDIYRKMKKHNYPILMTLPQPKRDFNTIGHECSKVFADAVRFIKACGHQEMAFIGPAISDCEEFLATAAQAQSLGYRRFFTKLDIQSEEDIFREIMQTRPAALFVIDFDVLLRLLNHLDKKAPDYRPDCIVNYVLPYMKINDPRVVGAIYTSHQIMTTNAIKRLIEMIEIPDTERQDILIDSKFVNAEQLDRLYKEQLADPFFYHFR